MSRLRDILCKSTTNKGVHQKESYEMTRSTQAEELKLIESIIAAHPSGIGIEGIDAEMKQRRFKRLHRRTLQRRLQKLINEHRVITAGASIAFLSLQTEFF